jgi:hypothetical protein
MAYKPADDVELIIGPAVDWHGSATPEPPHVEIPSVEPPRVESLRVESPRVETKRYEPPPEPAREEPALVPAPAAIAGFLESIQLEECAPVWGDSPMMFVLDPAPYEVLQVDLGALASSIEPARVTLGEALAVAAPLEINGTRPAESLAVAEAEPVLPQVPAALLIGSQLEPEPIEMVSDPSAARMTPLNVEIAELSSELAPEPWPEPVHEEAIHEEAIHEEAIHEEATHEEATHELVESASEEPAPPIAGWQPMPMWAAHSHIDTPIAVVDPIVGIPPLRKLAMGTPHVFGFALSVAPLRQMSALSAQAPRGYERAELSWLKLWSNRVPIAPQRALTKLDASPRLAGGCRYATRTKPAPTLLGKARGPIEFVAKAQSLEYPALTPYDLQRALEIEFEPPEAGLVALHGALGKIHPKRPTKTRIRMGQIELEQLGGVAYIPRWDPEPLRWIVASEQPIADAPGKPITPGVVTSPAQTVPKPFMHALVGFWTHAPRDLRLLIFAIPALLALAFHPSLPKVHVSTVQATEPMQTKVGDAVNGSWNDFKMAVSSRAAVALDEDFRSGLDEWQSPGGVATEWSFDANGFVRPGSLALYSPSLYLTDYQAQFLALIDKKALSWVVRAVDFDNYYVVKLVVLKPGPLTTLGMTRYAVIQGKAQDRVDTLVPLTARPDMLYRVRVDVHDDSFAVAIQGQMVDAWSETRLKRGGIGFFSARGEASRVRWLQVTHQYDTLGRLCSYLAPYDLSATNSLLETTTNSNQNGSWKQ